jgi:hypothetical protein
LTRGRATPKWGSWKNLGRSPFAVGCMAIFTVEAAMRMKTGGANSGEAIDFTVVCHHCGSLSIRYSDGEAASSAAVVRCGACNSPRGTLAALQVLANSNRRDLLDV